MEITLQYFDGCPNWKTTDAHLLRLISNRRFDATVEYQLINTVEDAEARQFHGSPTVLIDGVDPFADADASVGLACRIYQTEQGDVVERLAFRGIRVAAVGEQVKQPGLLPVQPVKFVADVNQPAGLGFGQGLGGGLMFGDKLCQQPWIRQTPITASQTRASSSVGEDPDARALFDISGAALLGAVRAAVERDVVLGWLAVHDGAGGLLIRPTRR